MASGKALGTDERRHWLHQWKDAAAELEKQRAEELRGMTPADAWAAIEAVLTFPVSTPLPEARRGHSGLVEMHRFLQTLRPK